MLKRGLIIVILILGFIKTNAQLSIEYNYQQIKYSASNTFFALLNNSNLSDSSLINFNQKDWQLLEHNKIKISYIPQTTWIKISVNNIAQCGAFDFINIDNPHINFLKCWIIKGNKILKSFELTGDNLPFATRPLSTTSFVFPVNSYEYKDCDIVVAVDKRFTKLDLPIVFCTHDFFIKKNNIYILTFGLIIGFCFLLFLFNTYLFASLKKSFYAWYCMYLLLISIYLLANSGLFFEYINPNYPALNDALRPAFLLHRIAFSSFLYRTAWHKKRVQEVVPC